MRTVMAIIGFGWALLGIANVVMALAPGSAALASGMGAFALIFNMVLFILPGLAIGSLGLRKAA